MVGVPLGRIIELSGNEGSGKSLLAYHIIANAQKAGGFCVYIDTERAANKEFMVRMGVDWNKLYRPKKTPSTIEEVFNFIETITSIARTHVPDKSRPVVVIWDSVAATMGKNDTEKGFDEQPTMALEARAMSRSLRKIIETLDQGYITLVCVNQLREKVGSMGWGDNDITPHGKALPFYSSVRIKLKSMKQIKDTKTGRTVGVETEAKVFKNKVGPNWRAVNFPLYYDWGVNDEVSIMDFLVDHDVIKGGTWNTFEFDGEVHKWQGTAKWVELMKNPKVKNFALAKIDELMKIPLDRRPDSIEIDPESFMEVEQLKAETKK